MPTHPYFDKNGVPLPGVTTILQRWKDHGGLMHWAHRVGYEQGRLRQAPRLYVERDKAADIGTYTHALIEADIRGDPEPAVPTGLTEPDMRRGRGAYDQFRVWRDQSGLFLVSWEQPMVSERFRYGGTPDAVAELDGLIFLLDWKTSSGVYADNLLQLAAYWMLFRETRPELKLATRVHVLRFSKDFNDFEHRSFDGLQVEMRQFLRLRRAYSDDQIISARI